MSTPRNVLIGVVAILGGCVLLCTILVVGTTALSAVGILPTPEPTVARTPTPTRMPGPTATPRQFIHDPTKSPSSNDRFTLLVVSAYWANRSDLPNRPGERWLLLSVQVTANSRASEQFRGGTVYESSFRLIAGGRNCAPTRRPARPRAGAASATRSAPRSRVGSAARSSSPSPTRSITSSYASPAVPPTRSASPCASPPPLHHCRACRPTWRRHQPSDQHQTRQLRPGIPPRRMLRHAQHDTG